MESVFFGIICVFVLYYNYSSDSVQTRKINIDIIYLMDFPRFDEKISKNSTLSIHFSQDHHCCRQQPFLSVNKFLSNHGPKPSSPNVQTQTFNTDCVLETQATTIGNTAPWRTVFALYILLKHSDTSTICNLGWECYKNLKGSKHLSTPFSPQK